MSKFLAAALVAVVTMAASSQAEARDLFSFQLGAGSSSADRFHMGTNLHSHHTDFRHHNHYYVQDGYLDPYNHARCQERVQADGSRQVICEGLPSRSSVPGSER